MNTSPNIDNNPDQLSTGRPKTAREWLDGMASLGLAEATEELERLEIAVAAGEVSARGEAGMLWLKVKSLTLIDAAYKGDYEEVRKLLAEPWSDFSLNEKDNNGHTALCVAAMNGHEAVVKMLIEAGAETETTNNDGSTPIILAAAYGHNEIVKLLNEAATERVVAARAAARAAVATALGYPAMLEKEEVAEAAQVRARARAAVRAAARAAARASRRTPSTSRRTPSIFNRLFGQWKKSNLPSERTPLLEGEGKTRRKKRKKLNPNPYTNPTKRRIIRRKKPYLKPNTNPRKSRPPTKKRKINRK